MNNKSNYNTESVNEIDRTDYPPIIPLGVIDSAVDEIDFLCDKIRGEIKCIEDVRNVDSPHVKAVNELLRSIRDNATIVLRDIKGKKNGKF